MAIIASPVDHIGDAYHLGVTVGTDGVNSSRVTIGMEVLDGEWQESDKDAFFQNLVDVISTMPEVVATGTLVNGIKQRQQAWLITPTEAPE